VREKSGDPKAKVSFQREKAGSESGSNEKQVKECQRTKPEAVRKR
jgi:hypothetical protein